MSQPMIDHARIDRHFAIELSVAMATADLRKECKALTEHSNRSFGQMIRQHEARMKLAMQRADKTGGY